MQLLTVTSILALAGRLVLAVDPDPNFDVITKPTKGEKVPAGSTYTIEWTLTDKTPKGTVTITLLSGPSNLTLGINTIIATGVDNTALKYDWDVSKSLDPLPLYGLNISLDANSDEYQYSNPFNITGGGSTSSSSSSSTASSSKTSSGSGTSATSTSTTVVTDTSSSTPTPTGNSTTTVTTTTSGTTSASKTSSSPTTAPTNAALRLGGSVAAIVGPLAMAVALL